MKKIKHNLQSLGDWKIWLIYAFKSSLPSDVAFPEKYVTENFQEIFRKFSVEPEKCIYS